MFAEGPASVVQLPQTDRETEIMPTVDDLATQRRQQALARQSTSTSTGTSNQAATAVATTGATSSAGSPQDLEEEAEGEGAFNPETGEINWDCPCLGGMANGPCGEQFKAAFSCFVYSKEEPKGMDCIENFKNMQDCFRQYPEVYGAELADEEDEEEEQPAQKSLSSGQPALEAGAEREGAASSSQSIAPALPKDPEPPKVIEQTPGTPTLRPEEIQQKRQRAKSAAQQVKSEHPITDETEEAVPKAWHDTRRAPPPPQLEQSTSSTQSLIDVDSPHVSSVPSDFESQSIKTDTQAERIEREMEDKAREAEVRAARAKDKLAEGRDRGKAEAKRDAQFLRENSDNPVVIGNAVVIAALAGVLGWGAYKQHQAGQLDWKVAGIGAGAVGLFATADYFVSKWLFQKYPPK
ncbi:MAG: Oxidoreductase [Bathelium mastoideum]|nr:MAG: Oxidoreductase [Bathelium mastoideum]